MQFKPVIWEDLEEIRNLQPADWSDIIPNIQFYIESPFCYPIKTKVNNQIVGIGASIVFENTAWLAHIIVDSHYRRQGIGAGLVQELLKSPENTKIETYSLIATELGQPVYAKAGFEVTTEYTFLQRADPWRLQGKTSNILPFCEEYRSGIYKMDKDISGEDRIILLENHLQNSMVYLKNKEIVGFYLPDLSEGLIYADTEEAGLELMKVKFAKIDKAALPSDNITGIEFLKQNGFVITEKKGTRMMLGKEIHWKPQKIYSRIGGNLG
jgi:GNAT superfamily N-acetyltransferase